MSDWTYFLHLSDIHFNKHKTGPAFDLDSHLRTKLILDVARLRSTIGQVAGVFVTGDIAWSGSKEQFDLALNWLDGELREALECDLENYFVVPGNHDVDRNVVASRPSLQDARATFRTGDHNSHALDQLIDRYIVEPDTFFAPLAEYNRFAATLECEVSPSRPTWSKDFSMNDGSTLRAVGLNTTLISDEHDHERRAPLVLGRHQTQLTEEPGVEYLTLAHHPPSWLLDGEDVADELASQVRLQLYGHKHSFRLKRTEERGLILSAGAVHPSRKEQDWLPYFGWIGVRVIKTDNGRVLEVRVYPRRWVQAEQTFACDRNECEPDREFKLERFTLPEYSSETTDEISATEPDMAVDRRSAGNRLTRRFFRLSYKQKMSIADQLDLHDEQDGSLNEIDRYKALVKRAIGTRPKDAWDLVEAAHNDGRYGTNPFDNNGGGNAS